MESIHARTAVHETPDESVERIEFVLYFQKRAGVIDGGFNLQPVETSMKERSSLMARP